MLEAFQLLARTEGILPALESSHALAWVVAASASGRAARRIDRAGQPVRAGATRTSPRSATSCGAGHDRRHPPAPYPDALEATLRARRDAGRKLLVPYVTGGLDDDWLLVLEALAGGRGRRHRGRHPLLRPDDRRPGHPGGVAAGPASAARTPDGVLADLSRVDVGVPLVVMTYYNLVYRAGHARIAGSMQQSGVRGAIIPDLPLEEVGGGRRRPTPTASRPCCWWRRRRPTTGSPPSASGPGASSTRSAGWASPASRPCWPTRPARWRAGSAPTPTCRCASASGSPRRTRPQPYARWPTAWWSARRWCVGCSRGPGPTAPPSSSARSVPAIDAG